MRRRRRRRGVGSAHTRACRARCAASATRTRRRPARCRTAPRTARSAAATRRAPAPLRAPARAALSNVRAANLTTSCRLTRHSRVVRNAIAACRHRDRRSCHRRTMTAATPADAAPPAEHAALDASTRSRHCSRCRSTISCTARRQVHRAHHDAERGAAVDAAVDQDRRLPRGLRLLPAGGALSHRRRRTRRCWRWTAVVARGAAAKAAGATRFCMGAAWRGPKERDLEPVLEMVRAVKALGLETCATLGMLKDGQAERLKDAGLDYYNHNLDTAPEFYGEIVTTRDVPRPARHARARARRRHSRLLRRHRRHGRVARAARRADRAARQPGSVSGVGADQQSGAGRGHAADDGDGDARSIRSNSCARSPSRASPCRRRWCGCRRAGRSSATASRRCVFSPARTRFSTATSCSRPAIPTSPQIALCSTGWDCTPPAATPECVGRPWRGASGGAIRTCAAVAMSAEDPPGALDRRQVRRAFERAAATSDAAAVVQREVGARMAERLGVVKLAPAAILDAGCGTGEALGELRTRYPSAQITGIDFALAMVRAARERAARTAIDSRSLLARITGAHKGAVSPTPRMICGALEALPLQTSCTDLIWSNLALQWIDAPTQAFAEFHRVLRVGGLLTFTTLGPDTLRELRTAFAGIDSATHVNRFFDMHDVGDMLVETRIRRPRHGHGDADADLRECHGAYPRAQGAGRAQRDGRAAARPDGPRCAGRACSLRSSAIAVTDGYLSTYRGHLRPCVEARGARCARWPFDRPFRLAASTLSGSRARGDDRTLFAAQQSMLSFIGFFDEKPWRRCGPGPAACGRLRCAPASTRLEPARCAIDSPASRVLRHLTP